MIPLFARSRHDQSRCEDERDNITLKSSWGVAEMELEGSMVGMMGICDSMVLTPGVGVLHSDVKTTPSL